MIWHFIYNRNNNENHDRGSCGSEGEGMNTINRKMGPNKRISRKMETIESERDRTMRRRKRRQEEEEEEEQEEEEEEEEEEEQQQQQQQQQQERRT